MLTAIFLISINLLSPNQNGGFHRFLHVQRLWASLFPYQSSTLNRVVSHATGIDPVEVVRIQAAKQKQLLYRDGMLVSLTFWTPNLRSRSPQIEGAMRAVTKERPTDFSSWRMSSDDTVSVCCCPDAVTYVQTAFGCDITNRVPWGALQALAGSREEGICRLPDGSLVPLDTCHKWLNDSIASGWMIGICLQSDRPSQGVIVASRKKLDPNAQPAGAASWRQPIGSQTNRTSAAAGSRR
jgi:hypothetical protein